MKGKVLLTTVLLLLASVSVLSAEQKLTVSSTTPVVDGVIGNGEYSWSTQADQATLYLNRTGDVLSAAIKSKSTGWVGIGFGSDRMNGAKIFIGYVKDGKPAFEQQIGRGHTHRGTPSPLEVKYALSEKDGVTVMELSFKLSDIIAGGSSELQVLVAYGPSDDFFSYHLFREALTVQL